MLKFHTRTQHTSTFIVTDWYAARATEMCDRALKIAHEIKNLIGFCCLSIFATTSFWQIDALHVK
jgi:hypothetical protein